MRTPAPGSSGIAHQEQVSQGTLPRVRGGWFGKRKSSTGVEGLEVAKLPGKALRMIQAPRTGGVATEHQLEELEEGGL